MSKINIQPGHIARHTPRNAGAQGREAAIVDIAQDLLLQHLEKDGMLNLIAIKGGTAIRKLYAGNMGRFSLDLDFAVANLDTSREAAALAFVGATNGLTIGPFTFSVKERRGKWSVVFNSRFVDNSTLATKLDFSPSPWLEPVYKSWVSMPIHNQYEEGLPSIKTVRLEENIAEKIARLNRVTTARDMYDLSWLLGTPSVASKLDLSLIRKLAVLKIWVDTNGLHSADMTWPKSHQGSIFNPEHWLRDRDANEFDLEDIGALAVPTPSSEELSKSVQTRFAFLADLDADEQVLAHTSERDRSLAIKMLRDLPGGRLKDVGLY